MAEKTSFDDQSVQEAPRFKRFRGVKGKVQRIFFFTRDVFKDEVHYKDDYGYYRCLAPLACPACEGGNKASTRFGTHVLVYSTDDDGKIKSPFSYEVQAFIFGKGTFAAIRNVREEWGDEFFKKDIVVNCTDEKYQKLTVTPSPHACAWSLQPNAKDVVADMKTKQAEMDLSKVIAPVINEETMKKVISGQIVNRKTKNTGKPDSSTDFNFGASATGAPQGESSSKSLLDSLAG